MAQVDDIDENFEKCDKNLIKGIRVLFKKNKIDEAIKKAELLQSKGYKVFLQPATIIEYSVEDFKLLLEKTNEIKPYSFYIVDTLGTMQKEQLLNLFEIADKNLDKSISIGFHSHNNLQLAFSNAQALMDLDTDRDIIIDSSVFGMGRGAGNLCTELLMQNLNESYKADYKLNPIYKIFDENLKPIFDKTPWGYSMPLFISAKYKCHPNYAIFLKEKGLQSAEYIDKIISKIENSKRNVFDKDYIEKIYKENLKSNRGKNIAFDLDGTLIDSSEGVHNAIRYVEKELNITPLDKETLRLCVGPPLKYTYGKLHGLSGETLEKAIAIHKKYMSEKGYKEVKLYDGIENLLKDLKNQGVKLSVATLKQESIAKKTLSFFGIDKYFDLIKGQNPSETLKKSDLLKQIQEDFKSDELVLVGDSKFDGEAAIDANIDFIAITYGLGFKNLIDTKNFNPIATCNSVNDLNYELNSMKNSKCCKN